MSIEQQPPKSNKIEVSDMPSLDRTVIPPKEHRDDKHDKKFNWKKPVVAVVGLGMAAGAAAFGYNQVSGGEAPEKKQGQELVLDENGDPVRYVPYEHDPNFDTNNPPAGMDRNGDGTVDSMTDVNENGVIDSEELWDQQNKEFVDPEAGSDEEALSNATEQDLANISEIESTFPDFDKFSVHWRAEFIALDPVVKERVMFAVQHPGEYPGSDLLSPEEQWEADTYYQFSRTPEDIQN